MISTISAIVPGYLLWLGFFKTFSLPRFFRSLYLWAHRLLQNFLRPAGTTFPHVGHVFSAVGGGGGFTGLCCSAWYFFLHSGLQNRSCWPKSGPPHTAQHLPLGSLSILFHLLKSIAAPCPSSHSLRGVYIRLCHRYLTLSFWAGRLAPPNRLILPRILR